MEEENDMQNLAIYRGEESRNTAEFVKEIPKQYTPEFDAQVEEYIRKLRDLEYRSAQPGVDHDKFQAEINMLNDEMMNSCAAFEKKTSDPFVIKAAQVAFRERTNSILSKSYVINRTRNWPQGHQGDYNTLEMAYKNAALSDGIGYFLDKYMLTLPLADGVRDRIAKLRDLVKKELTARSDLKVLDVACGSCREVFELAPDIKTSGAKFTCVDLDEDALSFALDRFTLAGLSRDQVELRKYNALRIFDFETAVLEFGMQDVIYSVGYFDYLPDDFLIKLLNSLYKMLSPGGKLIASFKDANRYKPEVFHWLVNWDGFLQRTEDDFERLLHYAEIPSSSLTVERVQSGSVLFYTAEKK